jgi:hypothetical protein
MHHENRLALHRTMTLAQKVPTRYLEKWNQHPVITGHWKRGYPLGQMGNTDGIPVFVVMLTSTTVVLNRKNILKEKLCRGILYVVHHAYYKLIRTNQQLRTKIHKVIFTLTLSLHVSTDMPSSSGDIKCYRYQKHQRYLYFFMHLVPVTLYIPWRWWHDHWNM